MGLKAVKQETFQKKAENHIVYFKCVKVIEALSMK
jgi:hypothetical protein